MITLYNIITDIKVSNLLQRIKFKFYKTNFIEGKYIYSPDSIKMY